MRFNRSLQRTCASSAGSSAEFSVSGMSTRIALLVVLHLATSFAAHADEKSFRACQKANLSHYDAYECEQKEIDSLWRANRIISNDISNELTRCTPHMVGYDYLIGKRELEAASARWRKFVKHDCNVTDATFGQGTGRADETNQCTIDHLLVRNERLQSLLSKLNETREYLLKLNVDSP